MLESIINQLFEKNPENYNHRDMEHFQEFKRALNSGAARAAEPDTNSPYGWRVNPWVKRGVLIGFRLGKTIDMSPSEGGFSFFDKSTFPTKDLTLRDSVRVIPGGSSIRDGTHIGQGVTCMPPMYVNVGAYVGNGTMIDSHALVGSCAQIGRQCHLSAAAQIGGVLEPVGALPVIVEDNVLVGGNCGVYEGTIVKERCVLGAGVVLTRSTPVYDLVRETIHRAKSESPLVIPKEAVVVSGSRAINHGIGKVWKLSLYTPVIVKYRDEKTDQRIQLEELLR